MMHAHSPDGPEFTGRAVIDEHGHSLGSVADVVFDGRDQEPEYLVVDPGVFRRAHYVPVAGSYEATDGRLVVPWDRHWIKQAPTASRTHLLTLDERHQLESHYAHP